MKVSTHIQKVVVSRCAVLLVGLSLAGSPVWAQGAAGPVKPETIREGELELDGEITSHLGEGSWELMVVSWTSPRGILTNFDEPKDKGIQATPDVYIHQYRSTEKLSLKDVKLDAVVSVIGKNGADGILLAREIILLDRPGKIISTGSITLDAHTVELVDKARAARNGGKSTDAFSFYNQALQSAEGTANKPAQGLILRDMGSFYSKLGQFDKALSSFNRSIQVLQGRDSELANSYNDLGISYVRQKKIYSAVRTMEKAVDLSGSADLTARVLYLSNLAEVYLKAEKRDDYYRAEQRLAPLQDAGGQRDDGTETLATLAMMSAHKTPEAARDYLKQVQPRVATVQSPNLRAHIMTMMARTLWTLGDKEPAKAGFEAAAKQYEAAGDTKNAEIVRSIPKSYEEDDQD